MITILDISLLFIFLLIILLTINKKQSTELGRRYASTDCGRYWKLLDELGLEGYVDKFIEYAANKLRPREKGIWHTQKWIS